MKNPARSIAASTLTSAGIVAAAAAPACLFTIASAVPLLPGAPACPECASIVPTIKLLQTSGGVALWGSNFTPGADTIVVEVRTDPDHFAACNRTFIETKTDATGGVFVWGTCRFFLGPGSGLEQVEVTAKDVVKGYSNQITSWIDVSEYAPTSPAPHYSDPSSPQDAGNPAPASSPDTGSAAPGAPAGTDNSATTTKPNSSQNGSGKGKNG